MQVTRNTSETAPGPSDWFTGTVYIDAVATPSGVPISITGTAASRRGSTRCCAAA